MSEPLLSVIIPVYNVCHYLKDCVDSVQNQTYKNLEIILVDDGSTDGSGVQCDEYSAVDKRIKVIHKTNEGLSVARNVGMRISTGDIIGFVDSDDIIHKDMYRCLIELLCRFSADIAFCSYTKFGSEIETRMFDNKVVCYTSDEILDNYVNGNKEYLFTPSVWKRIYRKEVIGNSQFPKGRCYEDLVWSAEVFSKSRLCVSVNQGFYMYRIRGDSIYGKDHGQFLSERIITDQLMAFKDESDFLRKIGKFHLADTVQYSYYHMILECYCRIKHYKLFDLYSYLPRLMDEVDKMRPWVKEYADNCKSISRKIKLYFESKSWKFYYLYFLLVVNVRKRFNLN